MVVWGCKRTTSTSDSPLPGKWGCITACSVSGPAHPLKPSACTQELAARLKAANAAKKTKQRAAAKLQQEQAALQHEIKQCLEVGAVPAARVDKAG